jgi:hypothetical protein
MYPIKYTHCIAATISNRNKDRFDMPQQRAMAYGFQVFSEVKL